MVFSLRAFSFHSLFDRPEEGAWILKTGLSGNRDERYLPTPDPTQELSALTQNRGRKEIAWQRNRANSSLPFGVTYL